uniref:CRISPR-associated endoribonuclease Cas2 n=1 Tax=candidate division CPR3 bacterium TaxID=2268181 RepID=A0A7V3N482_UNCC3
MKGIADYAVVYDITSDTERAKIDHLLKGFGFRIQKSVFECRLDQRSKRELIRALNRLNIKTGFVKIYKLEYQSHPEVIGKPSTKENIDDGPAFIV